MGPIGDVLGGDGWSLSAGDESTRGDTANENSGGSFGDRNFSRGGAVSMPGLIGIAAVVLGGLWIMNR
ncbi:hypothetical protein [Saccharospirillum salsuginis]|uniref:Uncharacterized protein n=1 Tax=Saccharospirillum salsuginis TaxID=418750 RepID=A0A918N9Y5_9GAMM|nr:hypothetical protein [Saccharospirillum salsuginis]GGX52323.1 hypothetical protein GCM10007392_19570 [Saccharospirillum salsuginis]